MAGFRTHQSHVASRVRPAESWSESFLQVDVSDLPKEHDWRNHQGQNYVDPVVDQGSCGSCYAVATTSMINSRIRIMTKNRNKMNLDYNQILKCNRYSQGCAGGFPYLVEKYAQDFGLTKSGKCAMSEEELKQLGEGSQAAKDQDTVVRVTDFGYVGGYYGGTTTKKMMHEIYHNGPVTVGINGGYELMHYESGIFIQTGEGEGHVKNDFEQVEHAVVVVGWAYDNGKSGAQHWIVKNSMGADWGEKGYFRIRLGGDTDAVTSLVTAAKPVLGNADYFNREEARYLINKSETLLKKASAVLAAN